MEKQVSEGSLHKWFKGSKSKDGKGGWVNVVTGGTCASDEPGEGTPKCVSSAKRASMTKAERLSAARRKKKADPGQQQKSGAAKPTYVSTDKPKKKKMKESYSRALEPLSEKAQKCWKGYEKKGTKEMFGKTYNNCVKKEEVEIQESDKKGKGSGKKDACYHKVKSRYSVWPSAYASGALVKCRKKGAANWGNSSKKEDFSDWKSEFIWEKKESVEEIQEIKDTIINIGKGLKRWWDKPIIGDTINQKDFKKRVDDKKTHELVEPNVKKEEVSNWRGELGEDWQKTNRQDKTDGMSQKAVNAYKRENPGSKLKTAVTKKPSSLKRGSKDAKRRKSFCSRMKGMKKRLTSAKTARDPDSRINKALRRWNC